MVTVDTGVSTLVINEALCNQLGLIMEDTKTAKLANCTDAECQLTEPVRIYWNNRDAICRSWVLPSVDETLLSVLPFEEMDLFVYPVNHKLVGIPVDTIVN